jgi:hypothetical protein
MLIFQYNNNNNNNNNNNIWIYMGAITNQTSKVQRRKQSRNHQLFLEEARFKLGFLK